MDSATWRDPDLVHECYQTHGGRISINRGAGTPPYAAMKGESA